jgi:hypothetical protein
MFFESWDALGLLFESWNALQLGLHLDQHDIKLETKSELFGNRKGYRTAVLTSCSPSRPWRALASSELTETASVPSIESIL